MIDVNDIGALALGVGVMGGLTLLGLLVAWWAAVGLFFALLVLWGSSALRSR